MARSPLQDRKNAKMKMSAVEHAQKLEAECVYWPTSRLVAHIAWTLHRGIGDVCLPQVDLAVARELDRRIPPPTPERIARARKGTP